MDAAPSLAEGDDNLRKPALVVVTGPTGTGKTALAVALALRFAGEVVNADSRYLYRGMDIGVAKPSLAERRGVPHHLIDIREPSEEMSLAAFQDLAFAAISDILQRGRLPILAGGTPLYINAVVEGWRMPRVPPDPEIRLRLEREIAEHGLEAVAERLRLVDPVAWGRSARNARRVIRALEVFEIAGQPMSELEGKGPRPYRTLELGLMMPRDRLRAHLNARIDAQISRGLVEEVRGLLDRGVAPDAPAMTSIGYRQILPYLSGETPLDACVQEIRSDTWRYVRHQETWLRRNARLRSFDVTAQGWRENVEALVTAFLHEVDLVPS